MNAEIFLPASKSISNRVLIIRALAQSTEPINNLSAAKDTQELLNCLQSKEYHVYAGEGATTARFLLAYFALNREKKRISVSKQLQSRPLEVLLKALEQLGCTFHYDENRYRFPLEIINGISDNYPSHISIDSTISSQFISSILLIAPHLKNGLQIQNSRLTASEFYFKMTIKLMKEFGIVINESESLVEVLPSKYIWKSYSVEADWSASAFFYSSLAIIKHGNFIFPKLKQSGLQGDQIVSEFFKPFGIQTFEETSQIRISLLKFIPQECVEFDFTHYPDLFPPLSLFCAISKTNAKFTGLQNLVYKESNRYKIITDFLIHQGVKINYSSMNGALYAEFEMKLFNENVQNSYSSYGDHRIAMAFALLNFIKKITIENPEVVEKSFPGFWNEFNKII